jgi:hypothetical protein
LGSLDIVVSFVIGSVLLDANSVERLPHVAERVCDAAQPHTCRSTEGPQSLVFGELGCWCTRGAISQQVGRTQTQVHTHAFVAEFQVQ